MSKPINIQKKEKGGFSPSPDSFDYNKMRRGLVRQTSDLSPESFDYNKMRRGLIRKPSELSPESFDYNKMRRGLVRQPSVISNESFDYNKKINEMRKDYDDNLDFSPLNLRMNVPKEDKDHSTVLFIVSIIILSFVLYFGFKAYYKDDKEKPWFLQDSKDKTKFNKLKLISYCILVSLIIVLLITGFYKIL